MGAKQRHTFTTLCTQLASTQSICRGLSCGPLGATVPGAAAPPAPSGALPQIPGISQIQFKRLPQSDSVNI